MIQMAGDCAGKKAQRYISGEKGSLYNTNSVETINEQRLKDAPSQPGSGSIKVENCKLGDASSPDRMTLYPAIKAKMQQTEKKEPREKGGLIGEVVSSNAVRQALMKRLINRNPSCQYWSTGAG